MSHKKRKGDSYTKILCKHKKKERKSEKVERQRDKRRSNRRQKVEQANPLVTLEEVNCLAKRSFDTHDEAIKSKRLRSLHTYQCPVCQKWHYTSKKISYGLYANGADPRADPTAGEL